MAKPYIKFNRVSFSYHTTVKPLIENLTLHLANGWTGLVGANGCGKTTLLKLSAGILDPVSGSIQRSGPSLYCSQRTDNLPQAADRFFASHRRSARILTERMSLDSGWLDGWSHISHGMRKRLQVAVALWREPDLLALDEPFNHLDMEAKEVIREALETYPGIGLVVSHDRELLDGLCDRCLFFSSNTIACRPGGYTAGMAEQKKEDLSIKRRLDQKKRARKKLQREYQRRKDRARSADRKLSKGNLSAKDRDAKSRIDLARLTGKDGQAGRLQKQLTARMEKLDDDLSQIKTARDVDLGIWLPGSRSTRNYLLDMPGQGLPLGADSLKVPRLFIRPEDRIALTGPNGSGKSTLIRRIVTSLNVAPDHLLYIPQEVTEEGAKTLLQQIKRLPSEPLGHLMTIVSRLNSRPVNLMTSEGPSPGETRKLMLALGILNQPHIIIMDEPTNHMDLPSITCLEDALKSSPCALLLVSHDRIFLEALTRIKWTISQTPTHFQLTVS